jgi:nicotinamide mononucleotide (NMN) deamidase PncC
MRFKALLYLLVALFTAKINARDLLAELSKRDGTFIIHESCTGTNLDKGILAIASSEEIDHTH